MEKDESILDLARDYFEFLNDSNVETAKRLFHEDCGLFYINDGTLTRVPLAQYLEMVANRESPKSRGEPVFGEIVSLEQGGADTAVLRVLSAAQPRYFEDFLSLLRDRGKWKIVAKIFRIVPKD